LKRIDDLIVYKSWGCVLMKKAAMLMFIFSALFLVSGCGEKGINEDDVKQFVMEYKTNQYTVEDASNPPTGIEIGEKVKPFLSEEEYNYFMRSSYFHLITVVAENTGYKSRLKDIILEKIEETDDGSINYKYTMKVEYYHDSFSELVETKGQLTIQYDGEQYQITRDWEQPNDFVQQAILKKK
jgi:hypothetical protein